MKKRSRSSTPTRPARGAAILEDAGNLPVRAFVFLPHAHFRGLADQLARALLLEARARPTPASPFAGITHTNGRSLRPQRMPVK